MFFSISKNEAYPFPLELFPPKKRVRNGSDKHFQSVLETYLNFPISRASKILQEKDPDFWMNAGQERALKIFHEAAQRVPAYRDFLSKQKINPEKIKSFGDFQQVPPVDKDNYLRKYPMEAVMWDGVLQDADMIAVSSGSSGKVFFWPRGILLDMETTYIQELYLSEFFDISKKRTLYLDCFAMGMYIAGPIILNSALRIAQKGSPMTVMTPGLSMEDIMRILPDVASHYDQVILAGYPPYIKDVLEEAINIGIKWEDIPVGFILAGEGYSENWRDYIAELAGRINVHTKIINLYGTADASIVGHETPESIVIRRFADQDSELQKKLFSEKYPGRLPTLVQYYPTQKYFEVINDELHFTANSSIPLIRYNIKDDGGYIGYEDTARICKDAGYNISEKLDELGGAHSWKLPFVYLYGRSDFTVVFYGANVYPENIKDALDDGELQKYITGRFIMSVEFRSNQDPYLLIRVEMDKDVRATTALEQKIQKIVTHSLLDKNDEFRSSYNAKGSDKATPVIWLHVKEDENYFSRNMNKQRWTKKN